MKVMLGIDAVRYPLTGIGRYAYELARRLPCAPGIGELCYFRGGRVLEEFPPRPVAGHVTRANLRFRGLVGKVPLVVEAYRRLANAMQRQSLRRFGDFLFHGPNYYLPAHQGPCVATFHDLSIFLWPECHPAARVSFMHKELELAIKRADVLLTDSEFNRQEVAAHFGWSPSRIVVAPLASSADFHPMTEAQAAPVLARWSLRFGGYSLFVGTLDPRKNVDALLDAYERMPQALRTRTPLVVAGFEGWKSTQTIARLRAGERQGWARYLGYVDEESLPTLYAGARVFLYPSRYEGFGLPVLEAMACGVPVICADAASLPEVTGGTAGAVLIDAEDTEALYSALIRSIEDDAWCDDARRRGLERAGHFSWDKTVAATLNAYELALR